MRRLLLGSATLGLLGVLLLQTPALAHPPTCGFLGNSTGSAQCVVSHLHPHVGRQDDESPRPSNPDAPYYEYRYLPMCGANTLFNNGDVMCTGAASYCDAVGQEGIAFWAWRRLITPGPPRTEGIWEPRAVDCRGAEEPGVPTSVQAAQYVQREFQRLVVVSGTTRVDPGARTLINIDTIFSTDKTQPEALPPLSLLGHRVVITVTPEEYRWQFGDGASLTTTVPGRPLEKDVTHVYQESGSYGASVTISWSGTFTVDGGEPITIRGRATTTGPATPLQALTARTELVAE